MLTRPKNFSISEEEEEEELPVGARDKNSTFTCWKSEIDVSEGDNRERVRWSRASFRSAPQPRAGRSTRSAPHMESRSRLGSPPTEFSSNLLSCVVFPFLSGSGFTARNASTRRMVSQSSGWDGTDSSPRCEACVWCLGAEKEQNHVRLLLC